jgi:hypothetical protein
MLKRTKSPGTVDDDESWELCMELSEIVGDIGGVECDKNISLDDLVALLGDIDEAYDGDLSAAITDIRSGQLKFEQMPDDQGDMSWCSMRASDVNTTGHRLH